MDWDQVVKPVLDATYRRLDHASEIPADEVYDELGPERGDPDTLRALKLLYEQGYITGMMVQQSPAPIFIEPTERGLQKTSGWPEPGSVGGDIVELLLRLLKGSRACSTSS